MRRRYEVWFVRCGLADGSGAWWFRYLLTNLGRSGCRERSDGYPVQVWATWFPRNGKPETYIQGFPVGELRLSEPGASPFSLEVGDNRISEDACRGRLAIAGRQICWDLRYSSHFRVELTSKGWIGFSRTPHSDACFTGEIAFDNRSFQGEPLGYGMQGHNCGYRHRDCWTWTHLYFPSADGKASTFEALIYNMPLGLSSRNAVLWHKGQKIALPRVREVQRDPKKLIWKLECSDGRGVHLDVDVRGRNGYVHRLPYLKTDCSGQFEVANDSLAVSQLVLRLPGKSAEELHTDSGAALEMVGA